MVMSNSCIERVVSNFAMMIILSVYITANLALSDFARTFLILYILSRFINYPLNDMHIHHWLSRLSSSSIVRVIVTGKVAIPTRDQNTHRVNFVAEIF